MATDNSAIERLFRTAQRATNAGSPEMPLGFDTRVLAHARATRGEPSSVVAFLQRTAIVASIVCATASIAAYWEFNRNAQSNDPYTSAYTIADTAIATATSP